MKQFKVVLLSIIFGVAVGWWIGVNIGREVPWYSNPLDTETMNQKIKRATGETLEKGGQVLEQTGQSLQDKLKK